MGLYRVLPKDITEVDIIVAGGGTAGCIVASRLAEADPALSILVIEAGPNNFNLDKVIHPALFLENLAPDSNSAIFYQANRAEQLGGREPVVPTGGILGGGSSINFMLYTRAQHTDYDSWNIPGWSSKELISCSNKVETFHGPDPKAKHGSSGPVNVTYNTYRARKCEEDLISAAGKIGVREIRDLQDYVSNNGISRHGRYVGPDGRRQDAAHQYLHPLLQDGNHPNLHVLVEHKVVRVLFDQNKRAAGIEYITNPAFTPKTSLSVPAKFTVRARKLVVLSSGAIASPGILERSGVGRRDVLKKANIPLVADLPGVGHGYQDHHLTLASYKTNLEPHQTNDALMTGRMDRATTIVRKDPILGWNTLDVAGKIRPTEAEVAELGPEFKAMWDREFKNFPDRPLTMFALIGMFIGDYSLVPEGQYVTMASYTAYPFSRGHVHITGPNLEDRLDFDVGFFTDANDIDIKKQVWAYKKQREMMRRTKFFSGEVAVGHPEFPAGSKAALATGPLSGGVRDIVYSTEDDEAIEKWLRLTVATTWHSLGTAKMGPKDKMGVLDPALNVHGVTGLKVVDLSVVPENVAANTNNLALTIGEKGAELIAKDLGLNLLAKI